MEIYLLISALISVTRSEILTPDNIVTGSGGTVINTGNGINSVVIDGSQYKLSGPGTVINSDRNNQVVTNDIPGNPINIANSN